MDKIEFGKYLKCLRENREFSTRQVELYSGVSRSYISLVENGKREIPSPDILEKLSKIYKVEYEILMQKAGYITNLDMPKELQGLGIDYIDVIREAKESGLTPSEISELIQLGKKFKR